MKTGFDNNWLCQCGMVNDSTGYLGAGEPDELAPSNGGYVPEYRRQSAERCGE